MLVALVSSALVVVSDSSVSANDLPDNCSYSANDYHRIKFLGAWPSAAKTLAQDGFGWWSNAMDLNGDPAIQTAYSALGDTEAVWVEWGPDGTVGTGVCGIRYMEFYENNIAVYATSNPDKFRSFAAHEYGHVLGLGHAGKHDSHDGLVPVMATDRGLAWLSQDDRSGIQAVKHEDKSTNTFWPTPNASYEEGLSRWTFERIDRKLNSYGESGSKSLRIMAAGTYPQQAWNVTRLMDWQGHTLDRFRVAAFIRRPFSNISGHVTLAVMVGRATYTHGESNGYPDITGWDGAEIIQNNGATTTWTSWYGVDCSPTSSWTVCVDPTWRTKPSAADAVEFGTIAIPSMFITGTSTPSWVDVDQLSFLADF